MLCLLQRVLVAQALFGAKEGEVIAVINDDIDQCPKLNPRYRTTGETGPRVVIASYPRSGNSLVRSILESASGIFTGSDMDGHVPGANAAKVTDDRVFAIKTHWPARQGVPYDVQKGPLFFSLLAA